MHLFTLYTAGVLVTLLCLQIAGSMLGECVGVLTNGADASHIGLHKAAKLVEFCLAPAIGVGAAFAYGEAKWPKLALVLTVGHAVFE